MCEKSCLSSRSSAFQLYAVVGQFKQEQKTARSQDGTCSDIPSIKKFLVMSLFDALPRIISFRNNSYSAPIFDALPSLSSSFVRTFSLSTRSLSGILGDHGFLEQRNFYWTNMLGIDLVGAESSCVRGVVENVRTLAAASFFLGTALVSRIECFGPGNPI